MLNIGQAPAYNLDISYEARQAAKNGKLLTLPLETINPEALEKSRMEAEITRLNKVNDGLVKAWIVLGGLCLVLLLVINVSPWVLACIPAAIAVKWVREKLKECGGN